MKNSRVMFVGVFVLVVGLVVGVLEITGQEAMQISFVAGSLLGLLNAAALYYSWKKVFEKKSKALSGGVIALKYPVLALLVYECLKQKSINPAWFVIGMTSLFPTALISMFFWSITTTKRKAQVSLKIEDEPLYQKASTAQ